ncbi:MAG: leucine-rich repeat domain-containing protein [Promethearchaeota archaeon]
MQEKEFKLNDYLTVKLEYIEYLNDNKGLVPKWEVESWYEGFNEVNIYISGSFIKPRRYRGNYYNLIEKTANSIPFKDINMDSITIDEIASYLDHSLNKYCYSKDPKNEKWNVYKVSPEIEFWGLCSNLQVWVENNYDTTLLHRGIAFPLLKELVKAGDPKAVQVFKKEIIKRIISNSRYIIPYLIEKEFLESLDIVDISEILKTPEVQLFEIIIEELKWIDTKLFINSKKLINNIGEYSSEYIKTKFFEIIQKGNIDFIKNSILLGLFDFLEPLELENLLNNAKFNMKLKIVQAIDETQNTDVFIYIILKTLDEKTLIDIYDKLEPDFRKKFNEKLRHIIYHNNEYLNIQEKVYKFYDFLVDTYNVRKIDSVIYNGNFYSVNNLELSICGKGINKISEIMGLDKLYNLKILNLHSNNISKIEGLNALVNLEHLNLARNNISKIEGLDTLINLEHLNLTFNKIRETSGLENLKSLKSLYLNKNQILKIELMENLVNLRSLDLSNNQIITLKGLNNIKNLKWVELENNKINEIEDKLTLKRLTYLGLQSNNIFEIKNLEALPKLEVLNLNKNKISNLIGLKNVKIKYKLHLKDNNISEDLVEELTGEPQYIHHLNPVVNHQKLIENLEKLKK